MINEQLTSANQTSSSQSPKKLKLELVPKTAWHENLRSKLSKYQWDKIRKQNYQNANYCCEICGDDESTYSVECNEVWTYDDKNKVQILAGLEVLCPSCHQVKHFGLSQQRGLGEKVLGHLAKINQWTEPEANAYVKSAFQQWHERSQHQWQQDISWLTTHYGIVVKPPAVLPPIFLLLQAGSLEKIAEALAVADQIEKIGRKKEHLLLRAVTTGRLAVVQLLVTNHKTAHLLNQRNALNETPLLKAVKENKTAISEFLMDKQADCMVKNREQRNVLHFAVLTRNLTLIRKLKVTLNEAQFSALRKQTDRFKRTPEMYVFICEQKKSIWVQPDKLSHTFTEQDRELYNYFSPYYDKPTLQQEDNYGKTIIHHAAGYVPSNILQALLVKVGKESINRLDQYNKTPLHEAAIGGHQNNLALLIKEGAQDGVTNEGRTAADITTHVFGQEVSKRLFTQVGCFTETANIQNPNCFYSPDSREPKRKKQKTGQLNKNNITLIKNGGKKATEDFFEPRIPISVLVSKQRQKLTEQPVSTSTSSVNEEEDEKRREFSIRAKKF
ncbi:MAG: ankyrin repeat domain-containing protein [Pseudomonadota bacterium]